MSEFHHGMLPTWPSGGVCAGGFGRSATCSMPFETVPGFVSPGVSELRGSVVEGSCAVAADVTAPASATPATAETHTPRKTVRRRGKAALSDIAPLHSIV